MVLPSGQIKMTLIFSISKIVTSLSEDLFGALFHTMRINGFVIALTSQLMIEWRSLLWSYISSFSNTNKNMARDSNPRLWDHHSLRCSYSYNKRKFQSILGFKIRSPLSFFIQMVSSFLFPFYVVLALTHTIRF